MKLKIQQQNAYYSELLHQEGVGKTKGKSTTEKSSAQRSQHITTLVPDNPYDPGPNQKTDEASSRCQEDDDGKDPIKDTFNQFLARARKINQ